MTATYFHDQLPFAPFGGAIPLHYLSSLLFFGFFNVLPFSMFTLLPCPNSPSCALKGIFFRYYTTQNCNRVYFPNTYPYVNFGGVAFHEDISLFSPPLLSPTPTITSLPLGFPLLVVIAYPPFGSLFSTLSLLSFSSYFLSPTHILCFEYKFLVLLLQY